MLPGFVVHHALSMPLNLRTLPWQALADYFVHRCRQSRFLAQVCSRSEIAGPFHVDHDTFRLALHKVPCEDYRLLASILGLGRWTENRACKFDATLKSTCQLCGEADGCLSHLLWDCPKLAEQRRVGEYDFSQLRATDIHPLIR